MRIVALLQFLYVNSRLKTAMKFKHLYILFLLLFGQVFSTVAQYNQSLTNYTLLKNNPEDLIPVTDLSLHTFALIVPDQEKYHPLINTLNRYADIRSEEHTSELQSR